MSEPEPGSHQAQTRYPIERERGWLRSEHTKMIDQGGADHLAEKDTEDGGAHPDLWRYICYRKNVDNNEHAAEKQVSWRLREL